MLIQNNSCIPDRAQVRYILLCHSSLWHTIYFPSSVFHSNLSLPVPSSSRTLPILRTVNLSDGVAPAARLQNRACGFHRTRLLSSPTLVTDAPLPGVLRPAVSQLRPKSHPLHSTNGWCSGHIRRYSLRSPSGYHPHVSISGSVANNGLVG